MPWLVNGLRLKGHETGGFPRFPRRPHGSVLLHRAWTEGMLALGFEALKTRRKGTNEEENWTPFLIAEVDAQKSKSMRSTVRVWYIDIQVLVSPQAKIPYLSRPDRLSSRFPLIYAKNSIHSIAKTLPGEMLLSAFPCCNYQIAPFPEHARWNIHVCEPDHPDTLRPKGAPTSPSRK